MLVCGGLWLSFPAAGASAQGADGFRFARGDFAGLFGVGDGRRMYLECHGRGRPTVVLEAGLRSRGDYWMPTDETTGTAVAAGASRFTRVCILDRPGTTLGTDAFSRSDPVPMPRTAGDAVADLRAVLRAARVPGPYVLGGHSTGGLIVRLFASTYPRQVAGIVQVDAPNEFLQDELTPGQMVAFDEINNGPLPGLEGYADLEQIGFRPSFVQMRRAARARPLRRMPFTVITRGQPAAPLPDGLPAGLTSAVHERAWQAAQDTLAALVPGGRHVVARRSRHYVMFSAIAALLRPWAIRSTTSS